MTIFNSKEIETLRAEIQQLKNQLQIYRGQEEKFSDMEDSLKKLDAEIAELNLIKVEAQDEIKILNNDKKIKESELNELSNKIPELNGIKRELQHTIADYTKKMDSLKSENANYGDNSVSGAPAGTIELLRKENEARKNEIRKLNKTIETLQREKEELEKGSQDYKTVKVRDEEKILQDLRERELRILGGIENKKEQAAALLKKVEELELRNKTERESLKNIYKEIEEKKRNREYYSKEEVRLLNNVARLKEKDEKLINEVADREQEIKAKDEILNMLTKNIAHKQEKEDELDRDLRELDGELRDRSTSIHKVSDDFSRISEEKNKKLHELYNVNSELETKSGKLQKLSDELLALENKLSALDEENEKSEALKKELSKKVSDQAEVYEKLKEQSDLLRQTLPLLERKKTEIENENSALEERFGKVFQKYSKEVNELSRKRIFYEKVVMDKEKEVNEKDQSLFEKIASLEESERVLGMRQAEVISLQASIKDLGEQKESLMQDIKSLDGKTNEILRRNDGLRMETEYLMSKKQSIEGSMKEILDNMNDHFEKARLKKQELDEEIAEYEDRLHITREKISESGKELSGLQSDISRLKLEHEEQRGFVTNLVAKKTKLLEEIKMNETLLRKYEQTKDKVTSDKGEEKAFSSEELLNEIKIRKNRDKSPGG
jgi:chromosome segregation ATPase